MNSIIDSKPYWQDSTRTIYNKDCRDMSELPDESVQMVCCSPPYWGLRKYAGLPDLIWGGDPDCDHDWQTYEHYHGAPVYKDKTRWQHEDGGSLLTHPQIYATGAKGQKRVDITNFCSLCGAWKGAYGLEPTPEMYIEHTIEILREIRRVLRKDGVVFWNIGDSYMSGGGPTRHFGWADPKNPARGIQDYPEPTAYPHPKIKPKDLCLIPFRVAIAAQEDGWWVRSVIIWNKPNPMPESVTDRPTESHEYILMLTKLAHYYYDQEAVRTPYLPQSIERSQYPVGAFGSAIGSSEIRGAGKLGARKMVRLAQRGYKTKRTGRESNNPELGNRNFMPIQGEQYHGQNIVEAASGSNLRSVWTFSTQSFAGAHFATYPEKLVEICIKAATPEVGCCSKCGKPWVRITERQITDTRPGRNVGTGKSGTDIDPNQALHESDLSKYRQEISYKTLDWQPQCKCNADKIPSLVLDPFAGSGTTLLVASKLGRKSIGYELSQEYCRLIVDRNKQSVMSLNTGN